MKMLWLFVPVLLSIAFILLPDSASAQGIGQIIPTECECTESKGAMDWGCVFQTIQNLLTIAISFAVIIATLVIAYAGALWILSPVNPQNREKGRTMLWNAVIGLAVVLAGWLLVDTVMKTLYNESASGGGVTLGAWNAIIADNTGAGARCIQQRADPPPPPGGGIVIGDDDDDDEDEDPNGDKDLDGDKNSIDNDDDGDGICDPGETTSEEHPCTGTDNCPMDANADQADSNGQDDTAGSAGDACEESQDDDPPIATIPARICDAANDFRGESTNACNCGGNACAWAVNRVLSIAGLASLGGTQVVGVESALQGGRGQAISQSSAVCGDIVVVTGARTSGGNSANHVGICLNAGCTQVISNSSSNRSFTWISGPDFRPSYVNASYRIYRVTN